jgi:hypothetical protein
MHTFIKLICLVFIHLEHITGNLEAIVVGVSETFVIFCVHPIFILAPDCHTTSLLYMVLDKNA